MPRRRLQHLISIVGSLALAAAASADLSLTLSSATPLNPVPSGQPFTLSVTLSCLQPGEQLVFLGFTLRYDAQRLGEPDFVNAGPIVPVQAGQDFLGAGAPGLADASFHTFTTTPARCITTSGVFATIDFTAELPGTGELAFDFASAFLFDPANPDQPRSVPIVVPPPLRFSVSEPVCALDLNADGVLNADDLASFITGYFRLPPAPRSDFNLDGFINADDLSDFITAYFDLNNGCPR